MSEICTETKVRRIIFAIVWFQIWKRHIVEHTMVFEINEYSDQTVIEIIIAYFNESGVMLKSYSLNFSQCNISIRAARAIF